MHTTFTLTIVNDSTAHELRFSVSQFTARCVHLMNKYHADERLTVIQFLEALTEAQQYWTR